VQDCGSGPFQPLAADDVLFIDSSHRLGAGGDLEFLLGRVLPALPAGTLVHFHDIFLPDGYPAHWAWRNYDEQPAVDALLACGAYEAVFSSAWIVSRRPQLLRRGVLSRLPLVAGALESSLWLVKTRADAHGSPPAAGAAPPQTGA
jgi:hypothetical protein